MNSKVNIKNLSFKELEDLLVRIGEKPFRAKQIYSFIYKGISSFDEMKNLPKSLRETLKNIAVLSSLTIEKVETSQSDGTKKYLFSLDDGLSIESVFMKYKHGNSICISSQAGCLMGCSFCASTLEGKERDLEPCEFIDQVLMVEKDTGQRINNIVVMGTGEPFDNYNNLSKFLKNINDYCGKNLGYRHITVSTCGIVPKILKFAGDFPQVNLAISLHSADNELRSKLMPVNKTYNLQALMKACDEYVRMTNRRITYEYILIKGVNDSFSHIEKLGNLLKGRLCHVNFIPLNAVSEREMVATGREKGNEYVNYLAKRGIAATLRRELGSDISSACGQLRLQRKGKTKQL